MKLRKSIVAFNLKIKSLDKINLPTAKLQNNYPIRGLVNLNSPTDSQLQKLYKKFGHAFATNRWNNINNHDWRRSAWILWYGKKIYYLSVQTGFLERLWQNISNNDAALKRLIYVYLRDFSPNKPNINLISAFIRQELSEIPITSVNYHWQIVQKKYQIFDQDLSKIANLCLQNNAIKTLQNLGLCKNLLNSDYVIAIYKHALQNITKSNISKKLSNIIIWSINKDKLRYPSCYRELTETLLNNWHEYDNEIKQAIQNFILKYLDHPRVKSDWQMIRAPLVKTFAKSLVKSSLNNFFYLLENLKLDVNWRYRQIFWQENFNIIDEAWIILGEDIQQHIIDNKQFTNLYANLIDDKKSCCLFMRIRNILLIEFSQIGLFYTWSLKNPYAPKLYKKTYLFVDINQQMNKIEDVDNWQNKLMTIIN
jgi:hypothetical protein